MGYIPPLTTDVTTALGNPATTLVGTANVESIIRANTLNQMAAPTSALSMSSQRLTNMAQGIASTDAPDLAQLVGITVPYVVSGCVWTADSPGSTRACSMTSGSVMINGILLTVAAVTSRTFTASNDTYVDFADNGDGTANITYTAVPNMQTSPALANSGTTNNTLRNACISAGASAVATAGIFQGAIAQGTNAGTQGSTTVAAGSNTHAITATPLLVASVTNFPSGGGYCIWTSASTGEQAVLSFTGTTAGSINGITVLAGRAAATVATGDTVTGFWPCSSADTIGNRIQRTHPFGGIAGSAQAINGYTTTSTASNIVLTGPVSGGVPLLQGTFAPFTVPSGPGRNVRMTLNIPVLKSSATAGTTLSATVATMTSGGGQTAFGTASPMVKVASDGDTVCLIGFGFLAAGSYNAGVVYTQGAAGTMTVSGTFATTQLMVELI